MNFARFLFEDHFVIDGKRHSVRITIVTIDKFHNYYYCLIDGIHTMNIGFTANDQWINLTTGNNAFSEVIGKLIEEKYSHLVATKRYLARR